MIELDLYQQVSRDWLLSHRWTILGDDAGVGKTHPAIFAAKEYDTIRLIVCPAYLSTNWQVELERCEETDVSIITGSPDEKLEAWEKDASWYIMSYELFARKDWQLRILDKRPGIVIFDEAHHLRGRNSARTKAAYAIRKHGPIMWMLTGTPLVANGGDVWPLLHIIDSQKWSSYWRFVEENCKISHTPWATKIGNPKDKDAFNKLLEPYMLRRMLEEVFPEIPAVVEQVITVDVSKATAERIKRAKKEYLVENPQGKLTRIGAGGLVTNLRSMTLDAKLSALVGLVDDIPANEQVVVFGWYRESVQQAAYALADAGHVVLKIDGGIDQAIRAKFIGQFQEGKIRVIAATLSSMQEGVNLQVARHVIFIEEHYVAAVNKQAEARLRRRGQAGTVLKYVLLTRKTIDASVHKAQAKRAEMALESVFDDLWEVDDGA